MVLIRATALLVLALAWTAHAPAHAAVFNPRTHTLDNGLQVIVVENPRAPVVLHMLWYKVGAADEPAAHAGLAHFFEHMMFKGTNADPDMDFSATVAALGGEDNAFTGRDFTAFFQTLHPARLPDVMRMEAARMTDLEMDADDIRVEKGVVTQERAQTSVATPEDRWQEAMDAAFYGQHPYARPVIGWNDTIASYTHDVMNEFYQAHYAPNNAVLVVSGDVRATDVFALAENIYGPLSARAVPPRVRTGEWPTGPIRLQQTDKDVRQPQLEWRWHAPALRTAPRDAAALQVLMAMVNMPDNVLQTELVKRRKLAVAVDASYNDAQYDTSAVTLTVTPAPKQDLTTLEKALTTTWHKALAGATDTDLQRAKRLLLESATLARDNIYAPAYAFGLTIATGGTLADVENWPDAISSVTVADIRRVAGTLQTPPDMAAQLIGTR